LNPGRRGGKPATNRLSYGAARGFLSSPSQVLSGVPRGSILGPLLFNVFIKDFGDAIAHSKYLLFADDIKIYRAIKISEDCDLLQSDINSKQGLHIANYLELSISKNKITYFSRKTNVK
jgi:hypothetical protein